MSFWSDEEWGLKQSSELFVTGSFCLTQGEINSLCIWEINPGFPVGAVYSELSPMLTAIGSKSVVALVYIGRPPSFS